LGSIGSLAGMQAQLIPDPGVSKRLTLEKCRPTLWNPTVKEPSREERQLRCFRKRRYRSQGDALDAALVAGVERQRKAYLCPYCKLWHLTTIDSGLDPGY
jgi:hypothetical protein